MRGSRLVHRKSRSCLAHGGEGTAAAWQINRRRVGACHRQHTRLTPRRWVAHSGGGHSALGLAWCGLSTLQSGVQVPAPQGVEAAEQQAHGLGVAVALHASSTARAGEWANGSRSRYQLPGWCLPCSADAALWDACSLACGSTCSSIAVPSRTPSSPAASPAHRSSRAAGRRSSANDGRRRAMPTHASSARLAACKQCKGSVMERLARGHAGSASCWARPPSCLCEQSGGQVADPGLVAPALAGPQRRRGQVDRGADGRLWRAAARPAQEGVAPVG